MLCWWSCINVQIAVLLDLLIGNQKRFQAVFHLSTNYENLIKILHAHSVRPEGRFIRSICDSNNGCVFSFQSDSANPIHTRRLFNMMNYVAPFKLPHTFEEICVSNFVGCYSIRESYKRGNQTNTISGQVSRWTFSSQWVSYHSFMPNEIFYQHKGKNAAVCFTFFPALAKFSTNQGLVKAFKCLWNRFVWLPQININGFKNFSRKV